MPVTRENLLRFADAKREDIQSLTRRVRDGDEDAIREFFERYCDRLFRYLLLLTRGNEDNARELLQIIMLKAMRHSRTFETERELWNWLGAIARNSFIDRLRRSQRQPEFVPLLVDDLSERSPDGAPEEDGFLFEALDDCLLGLEPDEQALIEGFYFEGRSHQSLAEQRNLTPKAVESKLARLRKKLRAAILNRLNNANT